jgi:hypothetical protein
MDVIVYALETMPSVVAERAPQPVVEAVPVSEAA